MKKVLFLIPIFLLAGINDSYAFKKGYQEGQIIKHMMFNRMLNQNQIQNKCLQAFKNIKDEYIQKNKNLFLKGCEEALREF